MADREHIYEQETSVARIVRALAIAAGLDFANSR
jgi:hypothetical protein